MSIQPESRSSVTVDHESLPSLIPMFIGFVTVDSAVVLFFTGNRLMLTARVDVDQLAPASAEAVAHARDFIGRIAEQGADRIIAVTYCDYEAQALAVRHLLHEAAGPYVTVDDAYHVHAGRWRCLETGESGLVDHSLIPEEHRAAVLATTRDDLAGLVAGPGVGPSEAELEAASCVDVEELLAAPGLLDRVEALALAGAVTRDSELYDRLLLTPRFGRAHEWAELWKSVVVHAPDELARRPLTLWGLSAWLDSSGAVTCLVQERLERMGCTSPVMALFEAITGTALPPTAWESMRMMLLAETPEGAA